MATYLVGDIQGCLEPLQSLLNDVAFDPSQDRLLCTGDMINRGPESLATIRFLMTLGDSVLSVLGNHDMHFLALAHDNDSEGLDEDLAPLLEASDRDQICAWLRQCPLLIEDEAANFLLTHAGVPHIWSRTEAIAAARELEAAIRGPDAPRYFAKMYGNKPRQWAPDLSGIGRLRSITNYFTRMRFINGDGKLNFKHKGAADSLTGEYFPWYKRRHPSWERRVFFFGHWAALDGVVHEPNVVALDTGCVWGNCLRLCHLEEMRFFHGDCSQYNS